MLAPGVLLRWCLIGVVCVPLGAGPSGPRFARPEAPKRPSPPRLKPTSAQQAGEVVFGAGACRAPELPRWWVQDVPRGNFVFVLLSPKRPPERLALWEQGIWATFVPRRRALGSRGPLKAELIHAIRTLTADRLGREAQVAGQKWRRWKALRVDAARSGPRPLLAHALAVEAPWGRYFTGWIAPPQHAQAIHATWQSWLEQWRVAPPKIASSFNSSAAGSIPGWLQGWWKSPRGQWLFGSQGQVFVEFDRRRIFEPDQFGIPRRVEAQTRLQGQANMRGDVLQIRWNDGSQGIFRWRVYRGDLLLTDQLGRSSRLKPLARWGP